MNWQQVQCIWRRELRDQLRDRRTLFVIGVLPLLIYPMVGTALFRLTQFMREGNATAIVLGAEQIDVEHGLPSLLHDGHFSAQWFSDPTLAHKIAVEMSPATPGHLERARTRLDQGEVDVVVYFPPGLPERLAKLRQHMRDADADLVQQDRQWRPKLFYESTRDVSQAAYHRVQRVLQQWQAEIVRSNLVVGKVPEAATQPFLIHTEDQATQEKRQAALWAKLLPFLIFICALTGAFYPAVDLCAGEKERGTLETLLSSPARRSEIVAGKLLTVLVFSVGSALCNLLSITLTGQVVVSQLNSIGAMAPDMEIQLPTFGALAWLLLALVPMAALFSAVSLALAAYARSTKEGQYYLMPLFLVCMPLMLLPLFPGVMLNLSTSLLPVTGVVLLLKGALEGDYWLVASYIVPVMLVTLACCAMGVRWAVDQFSQETILFRDTENFDLPSWIRHSIRNRGATPSFAAAGGLAGVMLVFQFAAQGLSFDLQQMSGLVQMVLVSQLGCILLPLLLLTLWSVRDPWQTFLLKGPLPWGSTALAVLLALMLHPVGTWGMEWILQLFPMPDALTRMAEGLSATAEWELSLPVALLLMAVLPAICEELAFRGFVFSGLRTRLSTVGAAGFSSLIFGVAHGMALQQAINATLLGVVLCFLAVKTRHLLPCIAFHMVHNGLQLTRHQLAGGWEDSELARWVMQPAISPVLGVSYTAPIVALGGIGAMAILWHVGCRKVA